MLLDIFRVLVVLMLCSVAILHVLWFLASWTPIRAGISDESWSLPGDVTIRSPLGRVWGLLALATMIAFLAAAVALLGGWLGWRGLTYIGVVLSFVAVAPWRRQSPGSTWLMAILADLVLLFLLALPISVDVTQAS